MKSKLTDVDLKAALRLQQDYDNLLHDVEQLMLTLIEWERDGVVRNNIESNEEYINICYRKIYDAINEGRFTRKKDKK
jgi:hypothetical protein